MIATDSEVTSLFCGCSVDMKLCGLLLLILTLGSTSCNVSTCADCGGFPARPGPPVVGRSYNNIKGGVQVFEVFYDHDSNSVINGIPDEYTVLITDFTRAIKGWTISSGLLGQRFIIGDTISADYSATVYSHSLQRRTPKNEFNLNVPSSTWLWNKKPFDTAILWNDKGVLIDSLIFSPH